MLRPRQYMAPLAVLVIFLALAYLYPNLSIVWGVGFVLSAFGFFLWGIFGNFLYLDRLSRKKEYTEVIELCEPVWKKKGGRTLRKIAGLYLAGGLVARANNEDLEKAETILKALEKENLSLRLRNQYFLIRGQLALYEDRHEEALEWLKQSTLDSVGLFHLARLFYFFSIVFFLKDEDMERSFNYAAKALEFFPSEPLYCAQCGLTLYHHKSNAEGLDLLKQALSDFPPKCHPWERAFYTRCLEQAT